MYIHTHTQNIVNGILHAYYLFFTCSEIVDTIHDGLSQKVLTVLIEMLTIMIDSLLYLSFKHFVLILMSHCKIMMCMNIYTC